MPTYQYACTECADELEVVQRFSDDALTICGACGGKLRKVFSPVGIVFKGSGFYRTDSRNGSVSGSSGGNGKADDGSGPDSSGKSESGSKAEGAGKPEGSGSGSSGSGSSGSDSSGSSGNGSAGKHGSGKGSASAGSGSKVA